MDGLAVATYLNNCILFTTRKTNVKKLNGGDESKIDNLFEQKAFGYKNNSYSFCKCNYVTQKEETLYLISSLAVLSNTLWILFSNFTLFESKNYYLV